MKLHHNDLFNRTNASQREKCDSVAEEVCETVEEEVCVDIEEDDCKTVR